MSLLLNGDCLDLLETIDDESVDLIFCDLPYATEKYSAISCKWNTPIDLDKLWIEFMRVKKINTPIIMTTTTKFGVSLINSAPKKCPFRYDLVWCKSSPTGFLLAKKMPMRKHEMIYVFYEHLPFYDLSSHTHKFIKSNNSNIDGNKVYESKKKLKREPPGKYSPPLPTSVIKEVIVDKEPTIINGTLGGAYDSRWQKGHQGNSYDPPLPTSVIKENKDVKSAYGEKQSITHYSYPQAKNNESIYDPPLPHSLLEIKSTKGKHSTEKPLDLMNWILKYYSKEGDVVLDPTMGSGSMGVVCVQNNRNFIGIEKDEEIFEGACERIYPEPFR